MCRYHRTDGGMVRGWKNATTHRICGVTFARLPWERHQTGQTGEKIPANKPCSENPTAAVDPWGPGPEPRRPFAPFRRWKGARRRHDISDKNGIDEELKLLLKRIILKLKSIISWWFYKNATLKVGVLIFWTLWILFSIGSPNNQDVRLYELPVLYVGGYFLLYFICAIVAIFINRNGRVKSKGTYEPQQTFNMQQVDAMTGVEFENFCVKVLQKNGFGIIRQTKATGDQGVDIIAERDNKKYAIQCKCYRNPVGNHSVMEVCSGRIYYGCDIGVVMTNSTFTPQAVEHARRTGIFLWDREIVRKMI